MNGAPRTVGGWTGYGFAHEACVYDTDAAVRARVLPFVEEGLDRGEPVVVVAGDAVRHLLDAALGKRIDDLEVYAPSDSFWFGGHETLATYYESMQPLLEAGVPWRLVGEPTWLATPGGEVWSRFESVANVAFADFPYYSLCLHDRRRLDPALVRAQLRVHPTVWDGHRPVRSPDYQPTEAYLRSVEPAWSAPPAEHGTLSITDVATARADLRGWLDTRTVPSRASEVLLAVYELVTNALRAAGAAEVAQWTDGTHVVWQISDGGPGLDNAIAGYVPPPPGLESGRGLWLARGLADDSTLRGTAAGTAVRLLFRHDEVVRRQMAG